jgi:nucleoid DNA-binding protein
VAKKKDLVNAISAKVDYLLKDDIQEAVNLVLDYLKIELAKANRIEIRGFGSFSLHDRKFANSEKLYKTIYYRASKATVITAKAEATIPN